MIVGISTFLSVVEGLGRSNYVRVFWGVGMWLRAARLSETVITFAGRRGAPVETAIAFAAMKWAILVRILVAVVTVVSTVAIQGRAVVMVVSC